jgi:hypothetical protein
MTYTTISTFNQNHPNHSTVFLSLDNTVTNLVLKQHLEGPTLALVVELFSRTVVQWEQSQGALSLRPAKQEETLASGQDEKV